MFRLMAETVLAHQDQSQTQPVIDMARTIPEIGLAITQDLAVELALLVAITEVRVDLASKAASSTTTIILRQIGDLAILLQELVQAQLDQVALLEVEKVPINHLQ